MGKDSSAFILSKSESVLDSIKKEIKSLSKDLSRTNLLDYSKNNISLVKCKSDKDIVNMINDCAPEHLVLLLSLIHI